MNWFPLVLSLRVALVATVIASTVGIALAYLLAKGRFKGRNVIEAIVTLPMVLPPTVLGFYLFTLIGVNTPVGRAWESLTGSPLVFSEAAAVIAASISALPFVVRTARAGIEAVDHRAEDVMSVAGYPTWRVAILVTLPLARPALTAGISLAFARALGDFGATLMIAGNIPGRTQTMSIFVYDSLQAGDMYAAHTGAAVLASIAVLALLALSYTAVRRT